MFNIVKIIVNFQAIDDYWKTLLMLAHVLHYPVKDY